jgi:hypothetical protein
VETFGFYCCSLDVWQESTIHSQVQHANGLYWFRNIHTYVMIAGCAAFAVDLTCDSGEILDALITHLILWVAGNR